MTDNLTPPSPQGHTVHYRWGVQFMIWMLLFTACFIIAQAISGMIIIGYYGVADFGAILSGKQNLNVLRFGQMLSTVLGFGAPALWFSYWKSRTILGYPLAERGFHPALLLLLPLIIVAVYPLINASYFVNQWMPWSSWMQNEQQQYKLLVEALLSDTSLLVLLLNLITVALLPAVAEEWLFRGTLQRLLSERLNIHIAVFLSAVLFSLVHAEFSGFLPRILLGMLLGYVFYYSGSLWAAIFTHLVNNGAQVILVFLNEKGIYRSDIDTPVMPEIGELVVYSLGFIVLWRGFLYFCQRDKMRIFTR